MCAIRKCWSEMSYRNGFNFLVSNFKLSVLYTHKYLTGFALSTLVCAHQCNISIPLILLEPKRTDHLQGQYGI